MIFVQKHLNILYKTWDIHQPTAHAVLSVTTKNKIAVFFTLKH
jgi:hypothetical protein